MIIEQRPFLPILLFDMQILKKNISCVATILLQIVDLQIKLAENEHFLQMAGKKMDLYFDENSKISSMLTWA